MLSKKIPNSWRALPYILGCVLLWSFIPVISRLGQVGIDHFQFLFWSNLLSCLSLGVWCVGTGQLVTLKRYTYSRFFVAVGLGFLGCFLYYLLLYFGYSHAPSLEVLVIQYMWPIFVVGLSALLLKEPFTWRKAFACGLGFLGVMIVLTKGHFLHFSLTHFWVDCVVFLAAITYAAFTVLSKKVSLEPVSATLIFYGAATVFSVITLVCFSKFVWPHGLQLVLVLLNGVLVNGLSYVLWLQGLRLGDASFIAPFVFLTPILACIWIMLLFHDPFLPVYALGFLCVIMAGLGHVNRRV